MNDRELLEFIAAQVGKLTNDMDDVKSELTGVKSDLANVKSEVNFIKKTVINIENDHGRKLDALFDGYKQNTEKLTRIEDEVKRHDEFIMRRIK